MARTAQLDLPLLMPSQAQKHVTVNEALARIDAVAQLRVLSSTVATPPDSAGDGEGYIVPAGAAGPWAGQGGSVAVWTNGGWTFLVPRAGWRAWDESRAGHRMFDGTNWVDDAVAVAPGGAAIAWKVHRVRSYGDGGSHQPDRGDDPRPGAGARRYRASDRGPDRWARDLAHRRQRSDNRYGSGLGTGLNSYLVGMSGSPVTYYAPTPLLLSAEGGSFGSGTIRLALHYVRLEPPRAI